MPHSALWVPTPTKFRLRVYAKLIVINGKISVMAKELDYQSWSFRRTSLTLSLVAATGILLTAILFQEARQRELNNFQLQFERDAAMRCNLIAQKMEECIVVIKGLQRFFDGSLHVDQKGFATFTVPFLAERKELQALEWIPRIAMAERTSYEEMRQREIPNFLITERGPNEDTIPAGVRKSYYPVFYVEPLKGNEKAVGFDLGSDPTRRAALEKARDTGRPTATERIRLVQETGEQYGFLIFLPVYRKGMPTETVEQRRDALEGFALGVFRAGNILWAVLGKTQSVGLPFDLLDFSAPTERQLLHHWSERLEVYTSWKTRFFPVPAPYLGKFSSAGRELAVVITAGPTYMERHYRLDYWFVLPVGFLLTFVVTLYIRALLGQRARLARAVLDRTAELRESEETFRRLFEESTDPILLLEDSGFIDCNPAAMKLFGYRKEQMLATSPWHLSPPTQPDGSESVVKALEMITLARKNGHHAFDWVHRKVDGSDFHAAITLAPIIVHDRQLIHATMRDITEHKRAEKALYESELRLRTILQTASEGFWLIDNDTVTMDLNARMCDILGRNREEVLGRKIFDFVDDENKKIFEHQTRLRAQREIGSYEIALSCPDESLVFCQFNATPLLDEGGNKVGSFAMVTDISERRQAFKKLQEIPSMLIAAQEEERKRLASELHDSIGQTLAALKFHIEFVLINFTTGQTELGIQAIEKLIPLLQRSIEETRAIYMGLRPRMLEDFGVISALRWYREELLRLYPQQHIEFDTSLQEHEIPKNLHIPIFRIAQEALNNASKHSKAEWVDVSLLLDGNGSIGIVVSDDGVGMDVDYLLESSTARSLGLTGMRERAEMTGGKFAIESGPHTGTTIRASWPIEGPLQDVEHSTRRN